MTLLRVLFTGVLVVMLLVTTVATMERGIFDAASVLWSDAWFRATLVDAYVGFLTVFVWVAYKERSVVARVVWFVLLMALGNIAVSAYVLIQLQRLKPGESIERLLLRPESAHG